jgi:hypothetical protein
MAIKGSDMARQAAATDLVPRVEAKIHPMGDVLYKALVMCWLSGWAAPGLAAGTSASSNHSETATSTWQVQTGLELGAEVAGERRLFWGLASVTAPDAGVDPKRHWWEFYIKPFVAMSCPRANGVGLYARLPAVGSGTLRRDPFDAGHTGRFSLEDAVAGLQRPLSDGAAQWDLSAGPQGYKLGSGKVLRSHAGDSQAAPGGIGVPTVVPDGRDGLQFAYGFLQLPGLEGHVPEAWVGLDLAHEWNSRLPMRAWGGRAQFGFTLPALPMQPKFTLGYQSFSGDDPHTSRLERFDPLFCEDAAGAGAWATGSKMALVVANTNVQALRASVELRLSAQDTLIGYYAHVRAHRLAGPLQFGEATRLRIIGGAPVVVAGITDPRLSNDLLIEYIRAMDRLLGYKALV